MIAIPKQLRQPVSAHENEQFLQMIPAIKRYAQLAFRNLQPEDREEAICEVLAIAFCTFRRLVELDKQDLAFATPLARFGVARFRSGRRVGNRTNCRDVSSVVAQRQQGFSLESLQSGYCGQNVWIEILADNKMTPVPDQVAFRMDFAAWLKTQNGRKRKLAKFLAMGNRLTEAAQRFRVSIPRISQLRGELQASWQAFQGETA